MKYTIITVLFSSSTEPREEDFLHRSIVPTDHFQRSLPRLPIPKLEDTCQRYLASQRPLLTKDEYKVTEKLVEDFKVGPGFG